MLKKVAVGIVFVGIITNFVFAQDEFFEPGYAVGGYGELHYNSSKIGEDDASKKMDFHRFIIYYGYNWTERWSFKSEVELEHNYVKDGNGELELEQAYVNYHSDNFGFQAGVILPSVGLINDFHEPPLFLSVERPDYSKYIIPTTWFGNGVAAYGQLGAFSWKAVMHEGLNGDGIASKWSQGIRGGRQKGYKANAEEMVYNGRIAYTGILGLRVGSSYTTTKALRSGEDIKSIGVSLIEVHAKYDSKGFMTVAEWGNISYTDHSVNSSTGYYVDLGYDIGKMLKLDGKLYPWIRMTDINPGVGHESEDSKHYSKIVFGLTYKPINQIAFKLDFSTKTYADVEKDKATLLNLGVGYNF
ncbi:MAG: hypothetical protein ISR82_05660 [Candidatus Marinimicrobia bacterium]|nr:hypothetical protein [Candidatus Neomarinimicrobiota bacterium]MBL7010689.1 hypothetical protein [Candidatus Neomarinimicrobiota bacterium]MBL7031146.1 hypothetical protein [Candidatus Neomarinimicrobiota bacterium]